MKILYIGNERRNAQAAATALRALGQDVSISWTQSLDRCASYLAQNRDLAALVVDAQAHAGKWPSSLRDLRSLQIRPAIIVVVPEGTPPTFDPLAPAPDDHVINNATFQRDLPVVVSRAVAQVRGSHAAPSAANTEAEEPQRAEVTSERTDDVAPDFAPTADADLERKLADLTAAFEQASRRHAAALAAARRAHELAATEQLTEQERQFQTELTLERDKRLAVEEMLAEAARALEEAEKRQAAALADADTQTRELERASKRAADLLAQSEIERVQRAALEQAIADAEADKRETQRRHDAALAHSADERGQLQVQLEELRAQFDRELSRQSHDNDQLRESLIKAELAVQVARQDHESSAADVARLTQREADLRAQLTQLEDDRDVVEGKLSDAWREIAETRESAARERAAVESRLELKLAREIDARVILERKLGEAQSVAFDAERKLREEAAALRTQLSDTKRALEDTRRELQATLERQATEHAQSLAVLATSIAERDERLNQQAARHDAALRAAERARAELEEQLQAALADGRHNIEHVQETLMATIEALEATKRRQDSRQSDTDRIPQSQEQPRESRSNDLGRLQQSGLAALQHNEDAALV